MSHFMPDDCTYPTVIDSIISILKKEWGLENSGRKYNFVTVGAIVGVDGLRRHSPFGGINRFTDPSQVPLHLKRLSGKYVQDIRLALDFELAVVTPFVGVTDFYPHCAKFCERLLLCLIPHPVEGLNLGAMGVKIGYPDKWRDYGKLEIKR